MKCIVIGFDNHPIFAKDISPTVYNELSRYSLGISNAGRKLDSLANIKIKSIMPSTIEDYEGKKAVFLECMDYYNSAELRKEIRKIIRSSKRQAGKRMEQGRPDSKL